MEREVRDSCGRSGTDETPQERLRRGGSSPTPRKASSLQRKSTSAHYILIAFRIHISQTHQK
ncbi:hypothetical protein [Cytobacillus praedii]|uniref:Uncharacterized protein n=1 Tax=Cytobacillus praedii TaxID=1742358 RepID=A0A4R1B227_9BACI|nr:hypothetical protein [Cytobacillus praedii]TCJ06485.1 hypothetical protein E0Y62_00560 [Cytobacillus praedii]